MFTEYERLNRVLSLYRDAMRRQIKQVLDDDTDDVDPGSDWYERKVIAKLPEWRQDATKQGRDRFGHGSLEWRGESQVDIPDFSVAVRDNPGFRSLAQQQVLTLMDEIHDARTRWAHPTQSGFRRAEVDRVAHQCAQVVAEFDEAAADEIRALTLERERERAERERNETLNLILEGVEAIRARSIHPDAMSDLVDAAGDSERIEALGAQMSNLEARVIERISAQIEARHAAQRQQMQLLADELAELKANLQPQTAQETQTAAADSAGAQSKPAGAGARLVDFALGPGSARRIERTWRRYGLSK